MTGRLKSLLRRKIPGLPGVWLGLTVASLAFPAISDPLEAHIEVNRNQIYLGESFILYLRLQGIDEPALSPDLSALPEAKIRALGSQSTSSRSIRIVNGRMHSESSLGRTFVYEVQPARAGTFTAGPVRLNAQGTEHRISGPAVTVSGLDAQDKVRIEIHSSRQKVYVSQPFTLRVDIAVRALPSPHSNIEPLPPSDPPRLESPLFTIESRQRGLDGPEIKSLLQELLAGSRRDPGFRINEYTVQNSPFSRPFAFDFDVFDRQQAAKFRIPPDRSPDEGNGEWHYRIDLEYEATLENDYVFGPLTFKGRVWTGANPDNTPRSERIFAVGPAATVRVIPPPEENRPECFIGTIGENLRVEASLDTQTCRAGDPLLLSLDITGDVSRENMRPPRLGLQTNLLDRFRIYDETVKTEKLPHGKRFQYRLRPLRAGSYELPPIEAAYFDPGIEEYRIARSAPLPLHVREGAQVSLPDPGTSEPGTSRSGQAVQGRGLDELPCGILAGELPPSPLPSPLPLAAGWMAGPLLFFVFLLSDRLRHRHRMEGLLRAREKAARGTLRTLRQAPQLSGPQIQACLAGYFQKCWGVPPGRLTPGEITPALIEAGCPQKMAFAWPPLLQSISRQSFAAKSTSSAEAKTWLDAAGNLVAEMERAAPSHPGISLRRIFAVLALGLAAGFLALLFHGEPWNRRPDASPERRELEFLWRRANSVMGGTASGETYQDALDGYRELALRGNRSPKLFYNMGLAAFMTGDAPGAVEVLRRAERLGGPLPGLRHNLRLALAAASDQPIINLPAYRVPLFWHFNYSLAQRLGFLTICWNLLWLCPILFGRDGGGEGFAALCLALCLLVGASVATSFFQEHKSSPSKYQLTP